MSGDKNSVSYGLCERTEQSIRSIAKDNKFDKFESAVEKVVRTEKKVQSDNEM